MRIPSSMRVRGREVNTISSPFSGSREFTNARQRLRLPPLQARGHASPRASVHGQFDRIDKMQLPGGEEGGEQQFSASGARLKTTMLMVIFGAGASFDSSSAVPPVRDCPVRDKTYRLPLANELFEARKEFTVHTERYPRCAGVLTRLRQTTDQRSVEQILSEFQGEAEKNSDRHIQLAAIKFYLQEMLWGVQDHWLDHIARVTNYDAIIDEIHNLYPSDPVCLVTFKWGIHFTQVTPIFCGVGYPLHSGDPNILWFGLTGFRRPNRQRSSDTGLGQRPQPVAPAGRRACRGCVSCAG